MTPQLGPDATPVGWVFQYALVDQTGRQDLASLRSFQDSYLRYWLASVDGVAEVASVGGFVRQYQINLDPTKLLGYRLSVSDIVDKVRMSNLDVGGRVVELSGAEYMVRGRGYIESIADIESIAVGVNPNGTPILLRDVATVTLGPDMRRGLVELDGRGEVVGGVVMWRWSSRSNPKTSGTRESLTKAWSTSWTRRCGFLGSPTRGPCRSRRVPLTTGVRTPVGIKIFSPDLNRIETIGKAIEMTAKEVPGTRSVYAERISSGFFLDFAINREEIAGYGLSLMDVNRYIESAIGGENIDITIEGRERYPINVRYLRELRDDPDKLGRVLVDTPSGAQVPLAQLATLRMISGPAMIRDEDGMLSGYVYVDMAERDVGSYVEELKRRVAENIELPPGYTLTWSEYEFMARVKERLKLFIPLAIAIIFVLY